MPVNGGRLIAFEGLDGSGKSTQLELLAARLRGAGHDIVTTREPQVMLDLACRLHRGTGTLKETGVRVATEAGGTSLVVVVSGGRSDPTESRHAVAHFPSGADSFLVRVDLAGEPRAVRSETHTLRVR